MRREMNYVSGTPPIKALNGTGLTCSLLTSNEIEDRLSDFVELQLKIMVIEKSSLAPPRLSHGGEANYVVACPSYMGANGC
jgi:hypothetical protein